VKKVLALLALLGVAATAYRRWQARRADAELWQEATNVRDLR
jgi:hypothetical protein